MKDGKITLNISGWPLVVTVLLCLLKLIGIINISWWWCFCLFWLPFAILFGIIGLITLLIIPYILIGIIINTFTK